MRSQRRPPPMPNDPIAQTRQWLQKAVIGLNLCPFAKAVVVRDQVRFALTDATGPETLLEALADELVLLRDTPAERIDTTLLIHPHALTDFLDYNDFLDLADGLIGELDLDGVLQVASFHPDYRFADSGADDIENYSNRSPYPMLHLLREDSIGRAVDVHPDTDAIVERNLQTLRRLGHDGWRALLE